MHTLRIVLTDKEFNEVGVLARFIRATRSGPARKAFHEGIRALKMELAMKRYLRNEFTLCKAAGFAGVGIQQMSDFLDRSDARFFRYSPDALVNDAMRSKRTIRSVAAKK